jgi:Tol biopolymer transport system component
MPLSAGEKLGPYEILALIGAGGMGKVFKATDTRLHRTVAIKILPHDKVADPERKRRFMQEARAASALNHPNIITLHDIASDNGMDYMVMEYLPGKSLDKFITPKGMPLAEVVDYVKQIAAALAAAHAAGIVHRDIKPANVMIAAEGHAKVLDFGLAKLEERAPGPEDETWTMEPKLTEAGVVMGTVAYMSPEQASANAVDHRTDIFSLGVVLYEMLAGQRPFRGKSQVETMHAIINDSPPALDNYRADLQEIFDKALAKDPKARYHHASDLALDLTRLLSKSQGATRGAASPRARAPRWTLAAVSAAAILLAAGFWRLATEPQQPDMSLYRLRPFAAEGNPELFPAWSPDGKSIAYAEQHGADWELTVKSLDGSPPAVLAHHSPSAGTLGILSISWTRDGSKLYYMQAAGVTFGPVFSVARAGGEPQQVLDGLADAAMLSPDGNTLAALMREAENGREQRVLTLTSPPGSSPKRLRTIPGFSHQSRIAWSPDGSKILLWSQEPQFWVVDARSGDAKAFPSPDPTPILFNFSWLDNRSIILSWPRKDDVAEARTDLWSLDTVTGRMTLVFPSTDPLTDPVLSPDGSSLAFTSGFPDMDLMELPLDGSPPRPLRATLHWESSPDWSPVAPEFVYVTPQGIRLRTKDGSRDAFIVTPSSFPGKVSDFVSPSFSPDGTRVAYTADNPDGSGRVWISPVNGGAPAQLGDFKGLYGGSWSPDGKWMVFNWVETKWPPNKLVKIRIGAGGSPIVLSDQACEFAPAWSPDGSRILCSKDGVLYTISANGGSPELLGREYEPLAVWTRDMRYIYAIRNADGKRELGKLDWKGGAFQHVTNVPKEWFMNTEELGQVRLSLAPDGKSLATTVVKHTGDIWILDGFQQPPSLWQRLWRK